MATPSFKHSALKTVAPHPVWVACDEPPAADGSGSMVPMSAFRIFAERKMRRGIDTPIQKTTNVRILRKKPPQIPPHGLVFIPLLSRKKCTFKNIKCAKRALFYKVLCCLS